MTAELQAILGVFLGAGATGLPLYRKWKAAQLAHREAVVKFEQKTEEGKIELSAKSEQKAVDQWKQLLEYREKELESLKSKDQQQDDKILELMKQNAQCQANDAGKAVEIEFLKKQLAELKDLLTKLHPDIVARALTSNNG